MASRIHKITLTLLICSRKKKAKVKSQGPREKKPISQVWIKTPRSWEKIQGVVSLTVKSNKVSTEFLFYFKLLFVSFFVKNHFNKKEGYANDVSPRHIERPT